MRPTPVLLTIAGLLALAVAPAALAETVVRTDDEGRPITFDVQAEGVDVDWHASLLRRSAHGDEIGGVTFHVVEQQDLRRACGPQAGGCYTQRRDGAHIVVPAGESSVAAHTLLHEYGHHVDATYRVAGEPEPNGTPRWFRARGLGELDDEGEVARSYRLGWDRSIGEIFAEDYAQLNLETFYKIGWLSPPADDVLEGLRRDLDAEPAERIRPETEPLVIRRRGTIEPGERRTLPFGLLGPGRRVTVAARLAGAGDAGDRARIEITCGERRFAKVVSEGERGERIDRHGLGPGECEVALVSSSERPLAYDVRLVLAVEAAA